MCRQGGRESPVGSWRKGALGRGMASARSSAPQTGLPVRIGGRGTAAVAEVAGRVRWSKSDRDC